MLNRTKSHLGGNMIQDNLKNKKRVLNNESKKYKFSQFQKL